MIRFFDAVKADRTRSWLYAACSLSYLGAMVSSNSALQFVSYPTQVERGRGEGCSCVRFSAPLPANAGGTPKTGTVQGKLMLCKNWLVKRRGGKL